MKNKSIFIASIVFVLSFLILKTVPHTSYSRFNQPSDLIQLVPERLRSFMAARLWERAEHLMHLGPVLSKQKFFAGSYGGNTDIIPLLKMVIILCPTETAGYKLLAGNYANHLDMKEEALKLFDRAIVNCSKSGQLHELYASKALVYLSSRGSNKRKEELKKANFALDKAIESFMPDKTYADPVFNIENYYVIKSRIFWELDEADQALETWYKTKKPLEGNSETLPRLLLKYKQTGIKEAFKSDDKFDELEESQEACFKEQHSCCHHEHHKEDSQIQEKGLEKEENLLQAFFILLLKAGFVSLLGLILHFRGSRFCGTVPCVILFFL